MNKLDEKDVIELAAKAGFNSCELKYNIGGLVERLLMFALLAIEAEKKKQLQKDKNV